MKTDKTKVKRRPDRGHYDKETVYRILDRDFICQIGFVFDGYPVVIPTIYGRDGNALYFHGANVSRMLETLEKGVSVSVNVTLTDALVLARSAFHHSLNYESVTLFGTAHLVDGDEDKMEALKIISDQVNMTTHSGILLLPALRSRTWSPTRMSITGQKMVCL